MSNLNDGKKVAKNYIFNAAYQVLTLIVPLVTTPYISRVLGADGVGVHSYTYSIVCYFVMLSILGTATYGNKQIGIYSDNPIERTKKFLDIYCFRILFSSVMLILYVVYSIVLAEETLIALIQSLHIVSIMINVNWFFQGMEDFKCIVIRNCVFKVLNIASVFIFVKEKDDLWKYAFLLAFLTLLGNISVAPFLKKYLVRVKGYRPRPFTDIRTVIQLFIPTAALQMSEVLDKTLIGVITSDSYQNGYYEQSFKIVNMALGLVFSIATVLLPKISKEYAERNMEKVKEYIRTAYNFVFFLGTPLMLGVMAVSPMLVSEFFGKGYEPVVFILPVMSVLFIVMGFNHVSGNLYFIACGKQNEYTKRIIIGVVSNIITCLALIPFLGAMGAAIGFVIGELTVMITQVWYVKSHKIISVRDLLFMSWKYLVAGAVMLLALKLLMLKASSSLLMLVVLIGSGAIIYFVSLLVLKEAFTLKGLSILRKKLLKK